MTAEQLDILTATIIVCSMAICFCSGFRAGQEITR